MRVLRTPDSYFENLDGFDYQPNYLEVADEHNSSIRMHYLDEGDAKAPVVLMLHGEPSWSYLYRKMIDPVVAAGYRVIAPDLIGFGRSDKPAAQSDYSHSRHVAWVLSLLQQLQLKDMTLMSQDWGGLIGLRLAAEQPQLFSRILAANTMLPGFPIKKPAVKAVFGTLDKLATTIGFGSWFIFSQINPFWSAGQILQLGTAIKLSKEEVAAYNAPFPERSYMAGAKVFPRLVPSDMDNNKTAWKNLQQWQKPFLCAFSDKDPIMSRMAKVFPALIPGCSGQAHTTIRGASHFLQDDKGEELAQVLIKFIRDNE